MPEMTLSSVPAIGWPVTNPDLIGGGIVRRRFTMGERVMVAGTAMTGDEIRAIRPQNRAKLIENRFLEIWPATAPPPPAEGMQRVLLPAGPGKYHVFEGQRITTAPLGKDEAMALAKATPAAPDTAPQN